MEQRETRLRDYKDRQEAKAEADAGYPWLKGLASRKLGYQVDYDNPRTFNEKIGWRKIHQRNPLFTQMTDKIGVREYVAEQLGEAEMKRLFPPVLMITDQPETFDFDALPKDLAIKCAHGSTWNMIVREEANVDMELAVHELRMFLMRDFKPWLQEYGYRHIPRRIVVEEMLFIDEGDSAWDMKLHCFNGKCRYLEYHVGHHKTRQRFHIGPDFSIVPGLNPVSDEIPERPAYTDDMVQLAEKISAPFDQLRVDFLTTKTRYYMNELTLYTSSGLRKFDGEGGDELVGSWWEPRPYVD